MNGNSVFGTAQPRGEINIDSQSANGAPDNTLFTAGSKSGFDVSPVSDFTVKIGGNNTDPDVAVLKNPGNETNTVYGSGGSGVELTLAGAPATSGQAQTTSIVAVFDPTIESTVQNGVDAVGFYAVSGAPASIGSQLAPNDATIRAELTNGAQVYLAVIANVTLIYGQTSIITANISKNKSKFNAGYLSEISATNVIMPSGSNGGASLGKIYSRPISSFAYGAPARLMRIGNIVYFFGAGAFTSSPLPTTYATISGIIPYGYRPVYTTRVSATRTSSSSNVGQMGIIEFTIGDQNSTSPSNVRIAFEANSVTDNNFTATWLTADPITSISGDENIPLN